MQQDKAILTIKIDNKSPIDLASLSLSFAAFSEEFIDFAEGQTQSKLPENMKLYVKELRSGSIIADLVTFAEQLDWMQKHIEVFGAFVTNLNEIANYFLGKEHNLKEKPTIKQAKNIAKIVDPVAMDSGSQLNIIVEDGGIVNIHNTYSAVQANAIQNGVNRFLGPQIPVSQMLTDQLLALEQVKNDSTQTGDRGVIETVSDKPIKLVFMSDAVKDSVINIEGNFFHYLFLVDVEVVSHAGKPKIYKIYNVKDKIKD